MARLNQDFKRFRGDNFTIVFNVLDASSLFGYKAEWTVYERTIDGAVHTITKKMIITTDGDFVDPGGGITFVGDGITFEDGEVHVHVTENDYTGLGSSSTEVVFDHQLRLWDGDDVQAIAGQGKWTIMVAPTPADLS